MSWKNVQYENGKFRTSEGGGGGSHTYSTTEQVVGTWIDGKPLYEKTFGNLSVNVGSNYVHTNCSITNCDKIIRGFAIDSNEQAIVCEFGYYSGTGSKEVALRCYWTNIVNAFSVQYTKTTD